jgi:lipopolysaccharide/colanic/teichoic acid biosynthesis glycosyltransferase
VSTTIGAAQNYRRAKWVFDFTISGLALLVLLPGLLLVGLLVKLTSPGPAIFSQWRVGRHGIPFRIYKFRTMHRHMEDSSGTTHTVANDPRVTSLGRFLRRTNIDELPQLWNVLKGDMSLVGPRPHVPNMRAAGMDFGAGVPGYELRHVVKPGITGLAQARGWRGEIACLGDARMRVACDLMYVRNASLQLDVYILLLTLRQELFGGV